MYDKLYLLDGDICDHHEMDQYDLFYKLPDVLYFSSVQWQVCILRFLLKYPLRREDYQYIYINSILPILIPSLAYQI